MDQKIENPRYTIKQQLNILNAQTYFAYPMFERILKALNNYNKQDLYEEIADCYISFYKKKKDLESREIFFNDVMQMVLNTLSGDHLELLVQKMKDKKQKVEDTKSNIPQIPQSPKVPQKESVGFFQDTAPSMSHAKLPLWPSSQVLLHNQILLQGIKQKVENYNAILRKLGVAAFLAGDLALLLRYAEEPSPKWTLQWEALLYSEYYYVATFHEALKVRPHPVLNRSWYFDNHKKAVVHFPSMALKEPDPQQLLTAQWGYSNLSKFGYDLKNNPIDTPESLDAFKKGILKFPANMPLDKPLSPMKILEAFTKQALGIPIDPSVDKAINCWINDPNANIKGHSLYLKKGLCLEFINKPPEYAQNLAQLLLKKTELLFKIYKRNFFKPQDLINYVKSTHSLLVEKSPNIGNSPGKLAELNRQASMQKYDQLFLDYSSKFKELGILCVRYGSSALLYAYIQWRAYLNKSAPWELRIKNMVSMDIDVFATCPLDPAAITTIIQWGFIPGITEGSWVLNRNHPQYADIPVQFYFLSKKTSREISSPAMLMQQYTGFFTISGIMNDEFGKLAENPRALEDLINGIICFNEGVSLQKEPVAILYAFKLKTYGMPCIHSESLKQIEDWCKGASLEDQVSQNLKKIIYNWIYWKKGDFGIEFAEHMVQEKNVVQKIYGRCFASAKEFVNHVVAERTNQPGFFSASVTMKSAFSEPQQDNTLENL